VGEKPEPFQPLEMFYESYSPRLWLKN
jgi:hypothetical protein